MATYINTIEDKDGNIILPRTSGNATSYDNTTSGLVAANLQDAIDEIDGTLDTANTNIGNLTYTEDNYVVDGQSLTDSIDSLDQELKDVNDNIGSLTYTEDNVLVDGESITTSLDKIDQAIIVDSGSNANGNYIRFADGTMICRNTITVTANSSTSNTFGSTSGTIYYGNDTWTYPYAFISNPTVVATSRYGAYAVPSATTRNIGTTSIELAATNATSGVSIIIDVIAVGKWK